MYEIIKDLPIDYDFNSKTIEQLKLYKTWFLNNKENRIGQLIRIVKSTKGFQNWIADFSPNSLKGLGDWLAINIETEVLSKDEYESKRKETPEWIEIPNWDLSLKSRSLLVDIGIYFGEVFINNHTGMYWKQYYSKSKIEVDNGHMVIQFKKDNMNPVWLLYILGLKLATKSESTNCLYNLFKRWQEGS